MKDLDMNGPDGLEVSRYVAETLRDMEVITHAEKERLLASRGFGIAVIEAAKSALRAVSTESVSRGVAAPRDPDGRWFVLPPLAVEPEAPVR